jgi:hypothetical protein
MIIGKIEIELDDLHSYMNDDRLQIINYYLNENKDIETIRQLIETIAQSELTLYTEEEFIPRYLYEGCEYNSVSEEQLQEFIKHKVIDPSKEVSPSYYSNFCYEDGRCIDPKTGKDVLDVEFYPCLIEFSYHSMMTFYIFEWYPDNDHCLEIED